MKRVLVVIALASLHSATGCSRGHREREYQGIVELHERVLSFEVPGRVTALKVRRGERVEAGQVLAVLDDSLELPQRQAKAAEARAADAQLDLLKAGSRAEDIRAAEAQLRGAKAAEETARDNFERTRKLYADGTVPPARLDEVRGQYERAQADRQSAEERVLALRAGARSQEVRAAIARSSQAQAVLDAADARLARFVLRAEATGAILDTHAEPGEVLQPGTPVVTLGETRRPYIDVFVPQTDLAGMGPGTPAEVRVDAYPGQVFRGAVEVVGRTLEFTPRYLFSDKERPNLVVRVRVDVEDSQERLHAGVPAFAWIAPQLEARK
ncbi:MAG TPA: HlyD family efflux transporter periplasmic adaptor subunit [Myxococcales bacterium]